MSYPKRVGSVGMQTSKEANRAREQNKKREQLRSLLLNKFKGKYGSGFASTDIEERIISKEVDNFLQNNIMSEVNLVKLDKTLAKQLNRPYEDMRSTTKPHGHTGSTLSKAGQSSITSISHASGLSKLKQQQIGAPSPSKSLTEKDEWTKIVDYDYQNFLAEKEKSKLAARENTLRI